MRRIRVDDALAAIPAGAYVEVFQHESRGSKNAGPQFALAGVLGSDDLASAIAGEEIAVIATADGLTTGLIVATAQFVTVTSSVATKQISLPAAIAGKKLTIVGPTNGCELISVVAGDKVNTVVVGATNEAALVAGTVYTLIYDGTDNWVMTGIDALGAVETPVVPNAL